MSLLYWLLKKINSWMCMCARVCVCVGGGGSRREWFTNKPSYILYSFIRQFKISGVFIAFSYSIFKRACLLRIDSCCGFIDKINNIIMFMEGRRERKRQRERQGERQIDRERRRERRVRERKRERRRERRWEREIEREREREREGERETERRDGYITTLIKTAGNFFSKYTSTKFQLIMCSIQNWYKGYYHYFIFWYLRKSDFPLNETLLFSLLFWGLI